MRAVGVLAVVVGLTACGGGVGERVASTPGTTAPLLTTAPPAPSVTPPAPAAARSVLPDLSVDDVVAGTKVDLSSLAPADQPLLVWFWAPH